MTAPAATTVGLTSWRLPAEGAEEAVRHAARLGADGVQLDLGGPGRGPWADAPGTVEAVLRARAEAGVALLGLTANTLNDIGLTAPSRSADGTLARVVVVRLLDAAHAYGVPLVFLPSFRRSAIDTPDDFRRTARILAWAATEADARGLVLANENVLERERAAGLVEKVGSPGFRLLLDPYNLCVAGRDPVRWVAAVGPYLADQIHLKDGHLRAEKSAALGTGDGRLDDVLAAVAAYGPAPRALVLENDYRDGDTALPLTDLAWARARAARPTPSPVPAPSHRTEAAV
ncbi:sugar phosphate isomerase/epimerase [Streptomyces sp. AS02]|uniref:sugar phosphate isomerase/epimerase family protein n=1 Tax=Streptomyces sp. AS02 TaxID=2938946 RepID=UPI0020204172|nr:TIM barrel protein [Streptomyces sp. AS02]MCL8013476.1 sugar phosphate isomerase/epimerase [Streptomyces sp. AS02]